MNDQTKVDSAAAAVAPGPDGQEKSPVALRAETTNPFGPPIQDFADRIFSLQWRFPFVPQGAQLMIFLFLVLACACLYCTVGIASQISAAFWKLICEAQREMREEAPVQKSAYAVATGIYFLAFLPFFLIQFPFWIIGWLWGNVGNWVAVVLVIFIVATVVWWADPELLEQVLRSVRERAGIPPPRM